MQSKGSEGVGGPPGPHASHLKSDNRLESKRTLPPLSSTSLVGQTLSSHQNAVTSNPESMHTTDRIYHRPKLSKLFVKEDLHHVASGRASSLKVKVESVMVNT